MGDEVRQPLVTVVVPTYTHDFATCLESPKTRLYRCLRSIVNQIYPRVEVLVCDDGTPEYYGRDIVAETLRELALELDDSRDITFKHLKWEHRGQSYVLNDGFAAARGDYVMDLNDDDTIMHDFLGEAVKFMEAPNNKDIGYLYSDYLCTQDRRNLMTATPRPGPWDPELLKHHYFEYSYPVIGLFRAYWAKKIKWDVELDHNEDWDYLLRFAQAGGKAAYIPGLYSFVVFLHPQQKSVNDQYGVARATDVIQKRIEAGYYG